MKKEEAHPDPQAQITQIKFIGGNKSLSKNIKLLFHPFIRVLILSVV